MLICDSVQNWSRKHIFSTLLLTLWVLDWLNSRESQELVTCQFRGMMYDTNTQYNYLIALDRDQLSFLSFPCIIHMAYLEAPCKIFICNDTQFYQDVFFNILSQIGTQLTSTVVKCRNWDVFCASLPLKLQVRFTAHLLSLDANINWEKLPERQGRQVLCFIGSG